MDDPFADIKIDRGVLKLKFTIFMKQGSWETSTYSYIFRYQNNEFTLIGTDYSEYNRGTGEEQLYSISFSIRKLIHTSKVPDEKSTSSEKSFELKKLKTIKIFNQPFTWKFEGLVL